MLGQITSEARCYAVKELARRAGVSRDFFERWTVDVREERTTLSLGFQTRTKIHFTHLTKRSWQKIAQGRIPVATALFSQNPAAGSSAPQLILPFCESPAISDSPVYRTDAGGDIVCDFDLLAAILFTLSRVEESLCKNRDEHGRFAANESLAARHDYLERPIIDEYGLAFAQVLEQLLPSWQPNARSFRFKLTHDIDDIGIPFQASTSLAHTVKRRNPGATMRDFLSTLGMAEPAELTLVRDLAKISQARRIPSAFYWKASPRGPRDSGYDPSDLRVQRVIRLLREQGFELGVHPGYETFHSRQELATEVDRLRHALRADSPGGRQHYLRWSTETWLDWEACGLSYDSSLGFADRFGFRAGTAYPYRPWCLEQNRELNLVEVPLILMDCTPVKYMKLKRVDALARIRTLVERTAVTGGVFTLLWHNTPLLDPDYSGWYDAILDLLSPATPLTLPTDSTKLW